MGEKEAEKRLQKKQRRNKGKEEIERQLREIEERRDTNGKK